MALNWETRSARINGLDMELTFKMILKMVLILVEITPEKEDQGQARRTCPTWFPKAFRRLHRLGGGAGPVVSQGFILALSARVACRSSRIGQRSSHTWVVPSVLRLPSSLEHAQLAWSSIAKQDGARIRFYVHIRRPYMNGALISSFQTQNIML